MLHTLEEMDKEFVNKPPDDLPERLENRKLETTDNPSTSNVHNFFLIDNNPTNPPSESPKFNFRNSMTTTLGETSGFTLGNNVPTTTTSCEAQISINPTLNTNEITETRDEDSVVQKPSEEKTENEDDDIAVINEEKHENDWQRILRMFNSDAPGKTVEKTTEKHKRDSDTEEIPLRKKVATQTAISIPISRCNSSTGRTRSRYSVTSPATATEFATTPVSGLATPLYFTPPMISTIPLPLYYTPSSTTLASPRTSSGSLFGNTLYNFPTFSASTPTPPIKPPPAFRFPTTSAGSACGTTTTNSIFTPAMSATTFYPTSMPVRATSKEPATTFSFGRTTTVPMTVTSAQITTANPIITTASIGGQGMRTAQQGVVLQPQRPVFQPPVSVPAFTLAVPSNSATLTYQFGSHQNSEAVFVFISNQEKNESQPTSNVQSNQQVTTEGGFQFSAGQNSGVQYPIVSPRSEPPSGAPQKSQQ